MNFESATDRELAANRISAETQLTRKVLPKIMICNVSHKEKREDVIHHLISKNKYSTLEPQTSNIIRSGRLFEDRIGRGLKQVFPYEIM